MPPLDVLASFSSGAPSTLPHSASGRGDGSREGQLKSATLASAPNPLPENPEREHGGGPIWHEGAFHPDTWTKADGTSPLPEGAVLLPKKRWLAEREQLLGRNEPVGLIISAGEGLDDIATDLPRFTLIALDFPKYSDGRAFSTARLLREKHGFAGELRAVGNVLSDQIPLMRRVGFDSFEVTHGPTRRALQENRIAEVTLHYQPAVVPEPPAGTRPWLRRKAG